MFNIQYIPMKHLFILALIGPMLLTGSELLAQRVVQDTIWVGGVCGMCEDRIERALDTKGVIKADYLLETHQLVLAYNTKKISEAEIHQRLNAVGHDTKKSKASDEQYDKIHDCCKYREHDGTHGSCGEGDENHDHDDH